MTYIPPSRAPVGTVIGWLKTFTNTPALPNGWVEANGQILSDSQSVYDGQTMPDLNSGTQRFLRGSTSSGTTGGSDIHYHDFLTTSYLLLTGTATRYYNPYYTDNASSLPTYYEVVFIFAVRPAYIPVGGVLFFLKSLSNTPSLPDGWVECNGQALSDSQSVYDGQAIPDLNGGANGQRFLRGSTTSGSTGGTDIHSHSIIIVPVGMGFVCGAVYRSFTQAYTYYESTLPSYYEAVGVVRIR